MSTIPSQEYKSDLFEQLSQAFSEVVVPSIDAQEIFKNIENKHMEFQRQLKASVPSSKDKERVYTL